MVQKPDLERGQVDLLGGSSSIPVRDEGGLDEGEQ